jgi:hypothetical protein
MTEALWIDNLKDGAMVKDRLANAAALSRRNLTSCRLTIECCAVALKDRVATLKDADITLKYCAAAAKDRGDTLKVRRLDRTLQGDTSKVLQINAVIATETLQQ